jgi:hypothetical protein
MVFAAWTEWCTFSLFFCPKISEGYRIEKILKKVSRNIGRRTEKLFKNKIKNKKIKK